MWPCKIREGNLCLYQINKPSLKSVGMDAGLGRVGGGRRAGKAKTERGAIRPGGKNGNSINN